MAGFNHQPLSGGAATYAPIALGTGSTTIHTSTTDGSTVDQIWLQGINNSSSTPHLVTITYGGVNIAQLVPGQMGPIPLLQGVPLAGNGTVGTALTAIADAGGAVWVIGYVVRINQ